MASTDQARQQLAAQQQGGNGGEVEKRERDPAQQLIDQLGPVMETVLPKQIGIERFARVTLNTIRRSPQLLQCDRLSLLGALATAAEVGLEPGTHEGHCYILPFRNHGKLEATFILGYKGLVELALRSGQISSVIARPVYHGEAFTYRETMAATILEHDPYLDGAPDDNQLRGCYAIARLTDGGEPLATYLSVEKIEGYRRRSKAPDSPAWTNDYVAMGMKTAAKRLEPWLPKSAELRTAVAADEQVAHWSTGGVQVQRDQDQDEAGRPIVVRTEREDAAAWDTSAMPAESGAPAGPPGLGADEKPLEELTKAQLQLRCRDRGLPTSGNKSELIARLRGEDQDQPQPEPEEQPADEAPAEPPEPDEPAEAAQDAPAPPEDDAPPPPPDEPPGGAGPPTEAQWRKLFAVFHETGITDREWRAVLTAHYGVASGRDLTSRQVGDLIDQLEKVDETGEHPGAVNFKEVAEAHLAQQPDDEGGEGDTDG